MRKAKQRKVLKLYKSSIANLNSILAGNGEPSGITVNDPGCDPNATVNNCNTDISDCCSGHSTLIPVSQSPSCNGSCNGLSCDIQCN